MQLEKTPREYPEFRIKNKVDNVENFSFKDFKVIGFEPYQVIKMEINYFK